MTLGNLGPKSPLDKTSSHLPPLAAPEDKSKTAGGPEAQKPVDKRVGAATEGLPASTPPLGTSLQREATMEPPKPATTEKSHDVATGQVLATETAKSEAESRAKIGKAYKKLFEETKGAMKSAFGTWLGMIGYEFQSKEYLDFLHTMYHFSNDGTEGLGDTVSAPTVMKDFTSREISLDEIIDSVSKGIEALERAYKKEKIDLSRDIRRDILQLKGLVKDLEALQPSPDKSAIPSLLQTASDVKETAQSILPKTEAAPKERAIGQHTVTVVKDVSKAGKDKKSSWPTMSGILKTIATVAMIAVVSFGVREGMSRYQSGEGMALAKGGGQGGVNAAPPPVPILGTHRVEDLTLNVASKPALTEESIRSTFRNLQQTKWNLKEDSVDTHDSAKKTYSLLISILDIVKPGSVLPKGFDSWITEDVGRDIAEILERKLSHDPVAKAKIWQEIMHCDRKITYGFIDYYLRNRQYDTALEYGLTIPNEPIIPKDPERYWDYDGGRDALIGRFISYEQYDKASKLIDFLMERKNERIPKVPKESLERWADQIAGIKKAAEAKEQHKLQMLAAKREAAKSEVLELHFPQGGAIKADGFVAQATGKMSIHSDNYDKAMIIENDGWYEDRAPFMKDFTDANGKPLDFQDGDYIVPIRFEGMEKDHFWRGIGGPLAELHKSDQLYLPGSLIRGLKENEKLQLYYKGIPIEVTISKDSKGKLQNVSFTSLIFQIEKKLYLEQGGFGSKSGKDHFESQKQFPHPVDSPEARALQKQFCKRNIPLYAEVQSLLSTSEEYQTNGREDYVFKDNMKKFDFSITPALSRSYKENITEFDVKISKNENGKTTINVALAGYKEISITLNKGKLLIHGWGGFEDTGLEHKKKAWITDLESLGVTQEQMGDLLQSPDCVTLTGEGLTIRIPRRNLQPLAALKVQAKSNDEQTTLETFRSNLKDPDKKIKHTAAIAMEAVKQNPFGMTSKIGYEIAQQLDESHADIGNVASLQFGVIAAQYGSPALQGFMDYYLERKNLDTAVQLARRIMSLDWTTCRDAFDKVVEHLRKTKNYDKALSLLKEFDEQTQRVDFKLIESVKQECGSDQKCSEKMAQMGNAEKVMNNFQKEFPHESQFVWSKADNEFKPLAKGELIGLDSKIDLPYVSLTFDDYRFEGVLSIYEGFLEIKFDGSIEDAHLAISGDHLVLWYKHEVREPKEVLVIIKDLAKAQGLTFPSLDAIKQGLRVKNDRLYIPTVVTG